MKHIVGFSGGIDSQACARWVLNRYPAEDVILLNSDAGGNEHRITTEFVNWYSDNIHPVIKISARVDDLWTHEGRVHVKCESAAAKGFQPSDALTFEAMMLLKGRAPSNYAQFCTEILKLRPQQRWFKENLAGEDYERYTGVRRNESEGRKNTPVRVWDNYYDCWLNNVICDWTKPMCFDYVKAHGEPVNELYTMGFSRVGCAPCVNANKEDIYQWATRSPDVIEKVRAWEKKTGFTFFAPIVPGMRINWIDDVVDWAMSIKHGGSKDQPAFPIFHERAACESKYGLCE